MKTNVRTLSQYLRYVDEDVPAIFEKAEAFNKQNNHPFNRIIAEKIFTDYMPQSMEGEDRYELDVLRFHCAVAYCYKDFFADKKYASYWQDEDMASVRKYMIKQELRKAFNAENCTRPDVDKKLMSITNLIDEYQAGKNKDSELGKAIATVTPQVSSKNMLFFLQRSLERSS